MAKTLPNIELVRWDGDAPFICLICDGEWNIDDGELVDDHLEQVHSLRWYANPMWFTEMWTQKQRVLR